MASEEMLRRIMAEGEKPIAAVARKFNVNPATAWRWVQRGSRTNDGRRVKLEAIRLPGGWVTSDAAVERFLLAINATYDATPVPVIRTAAQRRRESELAEQRLIEQGA